MYYVVRRKAQGQKMRWSALVRREAECYRLGRQQRARALPAKSKVLSHSTPLHPSEPPCLRVSEEHQMAVCRRRESEIF